MSDERLRELERRWRQSGQLSDQVAYLAERVRCGELARERLDLAAWLEDPSALSARKELGGDEALGSAAALRSLGEERSQTARRELRVALARWSPPILLRVILVAWLERVADEPAHEWDDVFGRVRATLQTLHDCLDAPWPLPTETLAALEAAEDQADKAGWGDHPETGESLPAPDYANTPVARCLQFACAVLLAEPERVGSTAASALAYADAWVYWREVCAALRETLVPWALGEADPLPERLGPILSGAR